MSNLKHIIVALDFADEHSTMQMLDLIDPAVCRVKVGKELFTRYGPQLVRRIHDTGFEVFLDLKFHDIPKTVAGAVAAASDLGVWMTNVHASGGKNMLESARKAISGSHGTKLVAVTVLTSLLAEDLEEIGIAGYPEQQVLRLAHLTAQCELDGVVCSAKEIELLRHNLPQEFILVTPGIRPPGDAPGDQKRIETPARALAKGANYLVIGRPITQAPDPALKLKEVIQQISGKK
jgi:orotidine-5'-phosphate decarboxylase